ncbi:hypothetical protein N7447_002172 [Penicillium robsamsonii]|uniref:uncharacterized protein n=1 Tax=Penicillium robsamsonii TaxID=1792511 RepID=UPI002548D561|nr:uncharacterized protein N7447_002172 [Penicillium robsamsonii]KAJ5836146.1 hypothetical protein N7447_002172 [Penicillium robsamsonii]
MGARYTRLSLILGRLRENSRFLRAGFIDTSKAENHFFNDNLMVGSLLLYRRRLYVNILITLTRDHWLKRFLKRNVEYYVRRRRALNVKRVSSLDGLKTTNELLLSIVSKKKLFNGSITSREFISVLEAISTNSFTYPPLIILSVKWVLLREFNIINGDKHIAGTDTSYINDTSILLFYKWTARGIISEKMLVLCDHFSSHFTPKFIKFMRRMISFYSSYFLILVIYSSLTMLVFIDAIKAAIISGCRKLS